MELMFYRVFRLDAEGAPRNPSKRLHLPKTIEELGARMEKRGPDDEWRFRARRKGATWSPWRDIDRTTDLVRTRLKKRQDNDRPDAYVVQNRAGKKLLVRELLVPTFEHGHVTLPSGGLRWSLKIRHDYRMTFGSKWEHGEPEFYGAESCRTMNLPGNPSNPPWSMHSWWPPVLAIDIGTLESDNPHAFADEMVERKSEHIPGLVYVTWRNNALHEDHNHEQHGENRSGRPACAA